MPDGVTLGKQIGVTDEYLRVWRLLLFNPQGMAALNPEFTSFGGAAGIPGLAGSPSGPSVAPGSQPSITDNQLILTSEAATGVGATSETYAAGLRIHFLVNQMTNQTPNMAEITLYNLKDDTAKSLIKEFNYCILQAGYKFGQPGTIFAGTIKAFKVGHENATDSYLKIYAGDGDQAIIGATVNETHAAGTAPIDKIQRLTTSMGTFNVTPGLIDPASITVQPNIRADVLFGMTADHLRDFAQANSSVWHILNDRLYWGAPKSYDPGQVVELNAASGLIGFPEVTDAGLNVTCLINPAIQLRGRVLINNKYINQYFQPGGASGGTFIMTNADPTYFMPLSAPVLGNDGMYTPAVINYEGDSRGGPWTQYMVMLSVDAAANILESVFGGIEGVI